jgi:hypothetical protein
MVYSKYKTNSYFPSFSTIFEEFDDEVLAELALYNPSALWKMCVFLSLDIQLEKEQLEKLSKGN